MIGESPPYNLEMFPRVLVLLMSALAASISPSVSSAVVCRAIDGDTIVCDGEHVRILNIDAPELGAGARCATEAALAERARQLAAAALAGSRVEVRPDPRRPRDRYGRTLAWVDVDGRDLGELLVAAGLARRWDGRRRPWCP